MKVLLLAPCGNSEAGPPTTTAGDRCQGDAGYKDYGPKGKVLGFKLYTSNHLGYLMESVFVWETVVNSSGLTRNWWSAQEPVLCKARGDSLALVLLAREDAETCVVFVDIGSCGGLSSLTVSQLGQLSSDPVNVLSQLLKSLLHFLPQKLMQSSLVFLNCCGFSFLLCATVFWWVQYCQFPVPE